MQVELIAIRDLSGDYGVAYSGDRFRVSEEDAESLIERHLAYRAYQQKMQPVAVENKMQPVVEENKQQPQHQKRRR